jgi:hypothetical protein
MKALLFTVPLLRLVIPLDSLKPSKPADAKRQDQAASIQKKSTRSRPRTLLRLVRIVTPLETVIPNKPKASLKAPAQPSPDQRLLQPAPKKKPDRTRKASRARGHPVSSRRKKK